MSKRRRAHRKPGIARYIAVGLAVGAVALLLIFVARRPADGDRGLLPDSEMAFSVPDHVGQLGELEKKVEELRSMGDLIAVGYDTPESLRLVQQASGASFPLLSDIDLEVTRMYDMELRPGWPMAAMGEIPEMGWVVVDANGLIRVQRVDLYFGDHADDILDVLAEAR